MQNDNRPKTITWSPRKNVTYTFATCKKSDLTGLGKTLNYALREESCEDSTLRNDDKLLDTILGARERLEESRKGLERTDKIRKERTPLFNHYDEDGGPPDGGEI